MVAVIGSFADRETERVFNRQFSRKLPPEIQRNAGRKLEVLNVARVLDDLRVPPGNRLEKLAGDRTGQYSIKINDQWCICFTWRSGDADDVEITDYHS